MQDHSTRPSAAPRIARPGMIRHWLGKTWLRLFGWKLDTVWPEVDKFVFIAAPHTSSWDLPFMLATSYSMRVPISWMGKRELFKFPFGWFLRYLGGIAVDRGGRGDQVAGAIAEFNNRSDLVLAIPAEGTRKGGGRWRSGFYHIARGANVPIGMGYLDYAKKRCGIGGFVTPTGDVRADMDKIRAFYGGVRGKFPEKEGVPQLREEGDQP